MITFVDTNVLLDVFLPDPIHGKNSSVALEKVFHDGSIIINEIIYAELAPQFENQKLLNNVLSRLGIKMMVTDTEIAFLAGETWNNYRKSGGKRERIIADFLIGAHAFLKADRLLTRDRGFYKNYFKKLVIMNPQK